MPARPSPRVVGDGAQRKRFAIPNTCGIVDGNRQRGISPDEFQVVALAVFLAIAPSQEEAMLTERLQIRILSGEPNNPTANFMSFQLTTAAVSAATALVGLAMHQQRVFGRGDAGGRHALRVGLGDRPSRANNPSLGAGTRSEIVSPVVSTEVLKQSPRAEDNHCCSRDASDDGP